VDKSGLRELSANGTTPTLLAGRYGPYVTDGTTNASIPKGTSPENLTFEQATELLAARRDAAPAPKRGGFKRKTAGAAGKAKGTRRKAARA
jgi:DNA topoisomerase-1